MPPQHRSKLAVSSTILALVAVVMAFVLPDEAGPAAFYFYGAILFALLGVITGSMAIAHLHHHGNLSGRAYAYFGFILAVLEVLFAIWAIGNATVS